jgi:ferrous iron transport protein B
MLGELNWAASVSAIQGLIAKEQVVSSMMVISGVAGAESGVFVSGIFAGFDPVSAYAFMVFNLFSAPCFGVIGAMRSELGSAKKTIFAVMFQILIAWILASVVFGIGSLIIGG